jgi:hypothetical protein
MHQTHLLEENISIMHIIPKKRVLGVLDFLQLLWEFSLEDHVQYSNPIFPFQWRCKVQPTGFLK